MRQALPAHERLIRARPHGAARKLRGIAVRWTSSAKFGVVTALSTDGHIWVTLSHGIFNEIEIY